MRLVNHAVFSNTVLGLILLNAALVGLETAGLLSAERLRWVNLVDDVILWIFTVEIALRIVAEWPRLLRVFTNGWLLFDILIVAAGHLLVGNAVQVLRLLRILRVLRVLSILPSLQRLVGAVLQSLPSMGSIMMLLALLFYVYAVLGVSFFGHASPEYFGSLSVTFLTLFEVVTLEGWIDIMHNVMGVAPWAWLYFVSFILLGTFVVFNLFVGVIVRAMEETSINGSEAGGAAPAPADPREEILRLRGEIAELKAMIAGLRDEEPPRSRQTH